MPERYLKDEALRNEILNGFFFFEDIIKVNFSCLKEEWRNRDEILHGVINPFTHTSKDKTIMKIEMTEKNKKVKTMTVLK